MIKITIISLLLFSTFSSHPNHLVVPHFMSHTYSQQISQQISEGIKVKLLANLHKIANLTAVDILRNQLQTGERKMKIIDAVTVNQIFGIFQLSDPKCDSNKDGYLVDEELKCLNKIWKYYVIPDPES